MTELDQALHHHQAGQLAEAEAAYRQILAREPEHADALHGLGVLTAQRGNPQGAVELIEQAIERAPAIPDYHHNLGEAYRALGAFDQAIAAYERALTMNPDAPATHYNLGNALQAQGKLDQAIAAYEQALALRPDYAEAHNNLGNAFQAQGQLDEAITAYRRALALKPEDAEAHNNLGNVLQAHGRFKEATSAYRQAIALEPDFADAYGNLVNALSKEGQITEVVAVSWQLADVRSKKINLPRHEYSAELRRAVSYSSLDDHYFQDVRISPDDVLLASYPRSGNHLVRFILWSISHYYRFGRFPEDFSGMKSLPDIHTTDLHHADTQPRIIKTHFPFDPRYRNVIHLVRDPRDVLVSYYYYTKELMSADGTPDRAFTLEAHVDLFLEGKVWPCDLRFHGDSFISRADDLDYIRVSYEDLIMQPRKEIDRLIRYLGWSLEGDVLEKLIAHVSFDNMVKLHNPESASRGNVFTHKRQMLRKGVIGGYKDVLSKDVIARIEGVYQDYIDYYGYGCH